MTKPRYARFYKCDLQMQTPIDRRHWAGEGLPSNPTDDQLRTAAENYIARCYEVGLEVIAITDHNLGGDNGPKFIQLLIDEAQAQSAWNGYCITVFPGFEIEAKTPGRCHLLCLFAPGTDLKHVDHTLSSLGLPLGQRFLTGGKPQATDKDLDEILSLITPPDGIVIAAHAGDTKGVLDKKQMADGWQHDAIRNERLLCIELADPREHYAKDGSRLGMIVRNDPGDWHRHHPIAVINNSDCKRLSESDGTGDTSWIGKRFTWIKMSEPTIEGLRQAFIDHESRIRFGDIRPEELRPHPRIESIKVSGAKFLADQEILLSPNMTTLIGGGGTGKSTIIEYLRAGLGQPPAGAKDVLDNYSRAIKSLGSGQVDFTLSQGAETINVAYQAEQSVATVDGAEVEDLATRFPVLVLGQREIFAIAESGEETLRILDQFQRDRIEGLRRQSSSVRATLSALDAELDQLPSLKARKKTVGEEIARRTSELTRIESQQAPLARLNLFRREQRAVQAVDDALERAARAAEEFAAGLTLGVGTSVYRSPDVPHADGIEELVNRAQSYVANLSSQILVAAEELREQVIRERAAPERSQWRSAMDEAAEVYSNVVPAEDEEQPRVGADELRVEIEARQSEAVLLDEQIDALEAKCASRPGLLDRLREVWQHELQARREIAERSAGLVPKTTQGTPFISVAIESFADEEALFDELNRDVDHRSVSEDELRGLCSDLRSAAGGENPLEVFVSGLVQAESGNPPIWLSSLRQAVQNALLKQFPEAKRRSLQLVRIDDRAIVTLRRMDGTEAGTLDSGLSVGQKCTAILALVLSAGENQPIVIDQPEDEIDNEFIYRELVPLLRKAKQERQVIIATHNPNLPVNGDAELIYPLQARSTGKPGAQPQGAPWRASSGADAIGSLDRAVVKEAVEEIMEGSEEAFQRRLARYGF